MNFPVVVRLRFVFRNVVMIPLNLNGIMTIFSKAKVDSPTYKAVIRGLQCRNERNVCVLSKDHYCHSAFRQLEKLPATHTREGGVVRGVVRVKPAVGRRLAPPTKNKTF